MPLALAGTAFDFDFGSSRWVVLAIIGIILLPIAILVAKQMVRTRREYPVLPIEANPSDRVSNRLVVLSSAAVLAVYSAGYLKTRAAADRLAQRERDEKALVARARATATEAPATAADAAASAPETPTPSEQTESGKKAAPPSAPAARTGRTAPAGTATSKAAQDPNQRYKDGIYQGRGSCPHGDIVAQVVVRKGQIAFAGIADCLTRYSCSVIKELPEQIVTRQSTEVDVVSGATESTEAFQDAVAAALSKADTQAARGAKIPDAASEQIVQ